MNTTEKRQLVKRLQEGKRRAKKARPTRLKAVESRMDEIEKQRKREADPAVRGQLIREIAALGQERQKFQD